MSESKRGFRQKINSIPMWECIRYTRIRRENVHKRPVEVKKRLFQIIEYDFTFSYCLHSLLLQVSILRKFKIRYTCSIEHALQPQLSVLPPTSITYLYGPINYIYRSIASLPSDNDTKAGKGWSTGKSNNFGILSSLFVSYECGSDILFISCWTPFDLD